MVADPSAKGTRPSKLRPKQVRTYATWHNSQTSLECKRAPRSTPIMMYLQPLIWPISTVTAIHVLSLIQLGCQMTFMHAAEININWAALITKADIVNLRV